MENGTQGIYGGISVTIIGKTHDGRLVVQSNDSGAQVNIKPENFKKN